MILAPFSKSGFFYPHALQLVNWGFIFGAILLMWKYAPFNPFVKIFFSFSMYVFQIYAYYARPYALGIFLIFLVCVLYKNRLKRPLVYSLLLVLLANTSIMGLVATFAFGIIFFADIVKQAMIEHGGRTSFQKGHNFKFDYFKFRCDCCVFLIRKRCGFKLF